MSSNEERYAATQDELETIPPTYHSSKPRLTAWKAVEILNRKNAKHRKGFRLAEIPMEQIINHAADELVELRCAPRDITELADVMACLIHYAVRSGWSEIELDTMILSKLYERFPEERGSKDAKAN